ncbi:MHO_1590 family protein [Mycoplasma sp. 6243]|uniref:MHO_1590 family protein n=1 Tax=Mycoplasma sp. 6243 TaxID=3440865 RepID=UPI003EC0A68C
MKKIYKFTISILVGFSIAGVGYGIYTVVNKKEEVKEENTNKEDTVPIKEKEIATSFPILEPRYFAKYVQEDEYGNYILDKKIVEEIIKDIIRRFAKEKGQIDFNYEQINEKEILLLLKYSDKSDSEIKKYLIKLAE